MMTAVTQALKRNWVFGPLYEEWLIVEHPDGTLEDVGIVHAQMLSSDVLGLGGGIYQFQWRLPDRTRQAAVLLTDDSRDESGSFRHPYVWDGPCGPQRWYLGPNAYRKAREVGWLAK